MASDILQLQITDENLIELIGWNEIRFLGLWGQECKPDVQERLRLRYLDTLMRSAQSDAELLQRTKNKAPKDGRGFSSSRDQYHFIMDGLSRTNREIPPASKTLAHLVLEVKKYNNTVNNVKVVDQLKDIGNPVIFSDRQKIIDALRLTREDLVRAIKTERILRENPNFKPEKFANNIASLEVFKITDRADSYGKYFDETMQIAISVQNEMKNLFIN